ncbi:MAG: lytic transglycosylase domain-containing protein [Fimbriimonadaceae bacterium]|nr:MAG: lytic transglycosylase domain-containing protein [Fimbriimonadaceae bacterium]
MSSLENQFAASLQGAMKGSASKAPASLGNQLPSAPFDPVASGLINLGGDPEMSDLRTLATTIAEKHGVDPKLFQALITQESGFNPKAVSPAGALGLSQLMPKTAKSLGVTDPFNATQNLEGGAKYLAQMMKEFNGDTKLALAAYNAGPGAVRRAGGIPPFQETQDYVKKILGNLNGG